MTTLRDRLVGCLIGTAVGDSLLLIGEGLSRPAIARRFPGRLRQRLVFGRGMVSDDTEHSFFTAQALLTAPDDPRRFARVLARALRWWLLCVPAGVGMATARGCIRLWLGVPPERSGVASGGNGPAMRCAVIGVMFPDDAEQRRAFTTAATSLTHRHVQGLAGAMASAEVAAWIVRGGTEAELWTLLPTCGDDARWREVMATLQTWYGEGADVDDLARRLGCHEYVSGWVLHSVPLALGAFLRHRGDAEAGLTAIFRCGGDTDTIGAIAGAWYGADRGEAAFPADWIGRIGDWPISITTLRATGGALAEHTGPIPWMWPCYPLRNIWFLAVVLMHGVRRMLP